MPSQEGHFYECLADWKTLSQWSIGCWGLGKRVSRANNTWSDLNGLYTVWYALLQVFARVAFWGRNGRICIKFLVALIHLKRLIPNALIWQPYINVVSCINGFTSKTFSTNWPYISFTSGHIPNSWPSQSSLSLYSHLQPYTCKQRQIVRDETSI